MQNSPLHPNISIEKLSITLSAVLENSSSLSFTLSKQTIYSLKLPSIILDDALTTS